MVVGITSSMNMRFEHALGDSEGQESLACCSPWVLQRVWHDCDWTHQRPQLLLDDPLYSVSSHWVPVCAPTPSLFSPELNFPLLLVPRVLHQPFFTLNNNLLQVVTFIALFNCPFPMSHLFPARFLTDAGWFVPFVWMLSCSRWFQREAWVTLMELEWSCILRIDFVEFYKGFAGGNNWDFFFPHSVPGEKHMPSYIPREGNWTEYSLGQYISFCCCCSNYCRSLSAIEQITILQFSKSKIVSWSHWAEINMSGACSVVQMLSPTLPMQGAWVASWSWN